MRTSLIRSANVLLVSRLLANSASAIDGEIENLLVPDKTHARIVAVTLIVAGTLVVNPELNIVAGRIKTVLRCRRDWRNRKTPSRNVIVLRPRQWPAEKQHQDDRQNRIWPESLQFFQFRSRVLAISTTQPDIRPLT